MPRLLDSAGNVYGGNTTIPTTAETFVISTAGLKLMRPLQQIVVMGFAVLTSGADATAVTLRIRRGPTASAELVSEANAETLIGSPGDTHTYAVFALDTVLNGTAEFYSLSVQQASATGNGTVLNAALVALGF